MSAFEKPPAGDAIPGLGYKLGEIDPGRGLPQVLDVLKELSNAEIPSIIVGARALVYYGAKRCPRYWEVCVPDDLYEQAITMFASAPLNETYDPWPKMLPQPGTNIHSCPCFNLKGVNFFFFISPAFENRANPHQYERSKRGVPYPKLEPFVQSLIETNRWGDVENVVDGMNLTEEWGDEHLDFSGNGLDEYFQEKSAMILKSLPPDSKSLWATVRPSRDPKVRWQKIVKNKEKRLSFKLPVEKYETRFRIKGSGDPRLKNREV